MIGRVLGNRYEIVERLGSGGMSYVYKARCSLLNRYVAVKILRPEFTSDESFIKKFKRESQAAASLCHQNIVNVYDVGVDGDIYYIVMEYVEGKTLKQLIKEKKRLEPIEAAGIARQVCRALVHAHKNHIIHRDIKPHNILITKEGIAKVTDFGIARAATGSTVTNSGNVIGSVHYFSPEQARGGYTDEKSDLYSLGIVMYEMVTGKVPFEGESPISVALKHLQEPVTPPGQLVEDLPTGLEQIIVKAVQKEADKRYNSAQEMLKDLELFLKDNSTVFNYQQFNHEDSPTIVVPAVPGKKRNGGGYGGMKPEGSASGKTSKKNRRKRSFIAAIIVLILLSAAVLTGVYLFKEFIYVKAVEVPDILGKTEEEARKILESYNLKMEVSKRQHNRNFPLGTIISQYPKPNTKNKITNPVYVVVSLGPEKTEVPNLINLNSYEAQSLLLEAGLEEGEIKLEYSNEVVVGFIIDQNPRPGIVVDQGTKVDLVVSAGPEPKEIIVPDVVGLDIETAKARIQGAGMVLADIIYKEHDIVPKGYVISQSISPGTKAEEGASINLEVSNGTEVVQEKPYEQAVRTEILTINLPEGQEDVKVTVKKYQDGAEEIIYQRKHDWTEGPLKVEVSGTGKVRVVVLFNDVPKIDKTYNFGEEE